MTTISDALSTLADKNRALLDRLIHVAGNLGSVSFQLQELLAVIDQSGSLDEIRAQAELARRALEQTEAPCK